LSSGDTLSITCSASEGATVTLSISGLKENCLALMPLSATDPKSGDYLDTRQGVFAQMHWVGLRIPRRGAYSGQIAISNLLNGINPDTNLNDLPLILVLSAPGQAPLRVELDSRLSILSAPIAATIQAPLAVTRLQAWDGARVTPLPKGVQFSVDALQNGWARMHFPGAQSLYISMDDLTLATTQDAKPLKMPSLENIQVKNIGESQTEVLCHFARGIAEDCPLQIQVQPLGAGKQRLILQFLYAECRCDFIHYPPISEALVEHIHWRAITPESMEVWVDLKGALAGYSYELFEHGWRLRLKMLPVDWKQTKILLDPGHGGHETGSTGLDGHFEKDLNLLVAQKTKQALEKEGFSHVYLSRIGDVDVSLKARGEAVKQFQADIVLSVHHNALPDGRNPEKERGVSTFYYHPFAKGLADNILHDLTQPSLSSVSPLEPLPALGTFYDSLYMTRIHHATAVLVEFGFFTSPQDYEKLIDPDFQAQEVTKLAHSVRNYCQGK
jgi:N-acetylmuramoyl-L-alanine amidase